MTAGTPRPPRREWPAAPGRASRARGAESPAAGPAPAPPDGAAAPGEPAPPTDEETVAEAEEQVEEDLGELTRLAAERDDYLDRLRRLQADFENYKKRVLKQQLEQRERAAEDLVTQLLPVLDNFDLGLAHGADGLGPVHRSLLDVLAGAGLERLDPLGQPFDPTQHDAVLHEAAEDGGDPEVVEVMRAGYRWKGRVLRAAMVKVKG